MTRSRTRLIFAAASFALSCSFAAAEVKLASIFSDHMVIQRGVSCRLWGTTTADATVNVILNNDPVATVKADADGAFRALLPRLDEPGGPHTIIIRSGESSVTLTNVLVGDVWLCSGQSNMEWQVTNANNRDEELASAARPTMRLITVPRVASPEPQGAFNGRWVPATPETVRPFSAVGYFFGRQLNETLNVPIGLIHSSWGGTPAEAWTPLPRLKLMTDLPQVTRMVQRRDLGVTPGAQKQYEEDQLAYLKAANRLDAGIAASAADWAKPDVELADWKPMNAPGDWTASGEANGTIWFRREIDVPAELAGQPLTLALGAIDDTDTTFFNGEQVGATDWKTIASYTVQRRYTVPAKLVKAGRNVIAIRVYDSGGGAGLLGPGNAMSARVGPRSFPLSGEWLTRREATFKPVEGPTPAPPIPPMQTDHPGAPATLYNGMIAPLGDFPIKGVIWYQGESNAPRYAEYEKLLAGMITAWREQFRVGDFPFYIVGLANYQPATTDPNAISTWANLREAQRQVGLTVPNAATTVTIDVGEARDIHPRNKQDVAKRLALVALKDTYGKAELVSRGPTFKGVVWGDGSATVRFDNVGGGLKAIGERLESFSIAGADGRFAWADAKIEGDAVVLTAAGVAAPTQVRYAWADNPRASLFNAEGLPAEPFQAKK